ncbi:MAG TPA: hypothetical protein VK974_00660 [Methylophilaceae bacterium]|nr:hypothetical protein [Methylophilaceae bacterium]
MITVASKLVEGHLDDQGVLHQDFVMQAATIGDALAAIEKAGPDSENLRLRIFKAAEQLQSLGTLEKSLITGELLLALPEEDISPLFDAQDEIEKKRKSSKKPLGQSSGS